MSIFDTAPVQSFVNLPFMSRLRRNHGLEHACLHILAKRFPGKRMAGHSDVNGFWLVGELETEVVRAVVHEAIQRMNSGEHDLAVHPNCGTNFVTAGTMAGMAGMIGMMGAGKRTRDKVERFPLVATLATLALMAAQPLGLLLQKHVTTSGKPGSLVVAEIIPTKRGRMTAHRVVTQG